jgi:siroheme synthase-like protein
MDLTGRPCVVIGGNELAEDRVRALLEAEAAVTIIAPQLSAGLGEIARAGRVNLQEHGYIEGELAGFALVFCTEPTAPAEAIAVEAHALGIPINVSDRPDLCSFIMPAVVRRGALQIAVSTGGASPALAKLLRCELEESIGPEYALLTEILNAARAELKTREPDAARRASVARTLATELRDALLRHDSAAVAASVSRNLGLAISELKIDLDAEL